MYLLLAILLLIFIIIYKKKYKIKESFDTLSGTVAVVGNGPLSETDRHEIQNYDHVIRFNDMKNKLDNEKTTVQVVRQISPHDNFFGKDKISKNVPLILIATKMDYVNKCKQQYQIMDYIIVNEPARNTYEASESAKVFENCSECSGSNCLQSSSDLGPSSGMVVLEYLENKPSITRLEVYGMNWNFHLKNRNGKINDTKLHHMDNEGSIINSCCKKCNVHDTPQNTYY